MRRLAALMLVMVMLWGCSGRDPALDDAVAVRSRLLDSQGCRFDAEVTADYGDSLYTFVLECRFDAGGGMTFTVISPETIAGISGSVTDSAADLTFDGQLLAFSPLAEGQLSPVSAPWVVIRALRGGYLVSAARADDGPQVSLDDSYAAEALRVELWLNENLLPDEAEIFWQGRRILSLEIENFEYL